ncbi:bifunctional riboflavin kinase/FAD synthetase [Paenibacillus beijingensis]|uniref:Riboflavin biosynthesis protein n=1 Tax=Paenibacillus beijingensis TaxID=1126833 RepID=A0A0D5NN92_9BACL|nr:bifunctional riboflavin kinase/FAD synthetase [Paenibacillus beijingensis]AJY76610.1 hypothetical protein VN24_21090 [Paenibacillus beijingensis]
MHVEHIQYPVTGEGKNRVFSPCSLAIGFFDGVHHGHRNVIGRAVESARTGGLKAAVMTFDPHPREVLKQDSPDASCLAPLGERLKRFAELGVDLVYVMRFDTAFAQVSPESFVKEVLLPLQVKHAVVGFDFTFGHRGEGTSQLLKELSASWMNVDIMPPLNRGGLKVSSSYIRESLQEGNVELAAELLGRPYEIIGKVVHGDARGRTIGFPTANIEPLHAYAALRIGVYAVTVSLLRADKDGEEAVVEAEYKGMLNHGIKPTFNSGEIRPVLEAHLFSFNGDIYDRNVIVRFHHFLRPERKFDGINQLIEQLGRDKEQAIRILEKIDL